MMTNLEKSKKVVEAWYEINNHPYFRTNRELNFQSPIYVIDPVLENGKGEISDNSEDNTKLRYWFEIITPFKKTKEEMELEHSNQEIGWMHQWDMDDGADTYEDAILLIHQKIIEKYGPFHE